MSKLILNIRRKLTDMLDDDFKRDFDGKGLFDDSPSRATRVHKKPFILFPLHLRSLFAFPSFFFSHLYVITTTNVDESLEFCVHNTLRSTFQSLRVVAAMVSICSAVLRPRFSTLRFRGYNFSRDASLL